MLQDMGHKKRSEARAREWADPVVRERRRVGMSKAAIRRYEDPAQREAASQQAGNLWQDPTYRQRTVAAIRRGAKNRRQGSANGMHDTPEYSIWRQMNQRCSNPNSRQFKDYGGRGIKVCDEWRGRGGFVKFIEHVGSRPSQKHSIGRIDNDGCYTPGNVRWETRIEQMNNFRRNRMVTLQSETLTLTQWARKIGISAPTLSYRIKAGWSESRILGLE